MLSSVHGLADLFDLANSICEKHELELRFLVQIIDPNLINDEPHSSGFSNSLDYLVMPPSMHGNYYLDPDKSLKKWLLTLHSQGTTLCSVCAGVFILATTGILDNRPVTTHWNLAEKFSQLHPEAKLNANKILINDNDVITAGGLMAWMDLALELVALHTSLTIVNELGKQLIVDTAHRQQSYYQIFSPTMNHGDKKILKAQHHIHKNFSKPLSISKLARTSAMTERTFLRHFVKATSFKPNDYLQRLRVQKACDLLQTTTATIEEIAFKTGYQDVSAFRKTFIKVIELTPKAFRTKFSRF